MIPRNALVLYVLRNTRKQLQKRRFLILYHFSVGFGTMLPLGECTLLTLQILSWEALGGACSHVAVPLNGESFELDMAAIDCS